MHMHMFKYADNMALMGLGYLKHADTLQHWCKHSANPKKLYCIVALRSFPLFKVTLPFSVVFLENGGSFFHEGAAVCC